MKRQLLSFLLNIAVPAALSYGATYYSQGSVAPELFQSWNDIRAGGGNSPQNFSSGDIFIIQNGHSMTNAAGWSVSGTGSKLWVENGGALTANFPVTLAKATVFQIDDGGLFVHNNTGSPSSTIFNGTESFFPNSTFRIANWISNLSAIPFGITWGNLIIDVPALNGSWNQVGNVFNIQGTLDIRQTGGNENEFRLCSRSGNTYTFSIGNITISGGILNVQGGGSSGVPTMNTLVAGNINISGGKLNMGTNGTSTLSLNGNITVSGAGKIIQSGATSKIIFSRAGVQGIDLTEEAMNFSLINTDINAGSTAEMHGEWVLSPLATVNVYGILHLNGHIFKPRALNVGGLVTTGGGIIEQLGTAPITVGGPSVGNTGTIVCDGVITMAPSSFGSFLIQPGGVVELDNGMINMNHTMASFFIDSGGTLNCGSGTVTSINSTLSTFLMNPGANLSVGSPEGISLTGATGNIQVGGARNYHYQGNYLYNAPEPQVTGSGLPESLLNLSIQNNAGVSLSQDVLVNGTLTMVAGNLSGNSHLVAFGDSGLLDYHGPSYQTTSDVEFPAVQGPRSLIISACSPSGISLHENRQLPGSLTISGNYILNIPPEVGLTVGGNVLLEGNSSLKIGSGASFIDNDLPISGGGTVSVERQVTEGGWHYISSPVQEALSGLFTGDYLKPYAEGTLSFGPYISSPNVMLKLMQGYALWPTTDHTVTFADARPNTGPQEAVVSRTYTGQSGANEYDGWNLVGNPYPSSVDLDVAHETWEDVEETAYFWDPSGLAAGNYTVYPAKAGFGTHDQYVPPVQGFFVRCNAPATHETPGFGSVRFSHAARVNASTPFLKQAKHLHDVLLITASAMSGDYCDKMVVHLDSGATAGYDPGYDAVKLWGADEAPQLYAVVDDEMNLTVNTLPFNKDSLTVLMAFKSGVSGTYALDFDSTETFAEEYGLLLEDLRLGAKQDLRLTPHYELNYDVNDPPERFLLHINHSRLGTGDKIDDKRISLYSDHGEIVICNTGGEDLKGSLVVYDLQGREVLREMIKNERKVRIDPGLRSGVYVVQISAGFGVISRRLFLETP